jgi:regulator of protease activity HflC (stomatin/prohibitin superfamily)
MPIVPIVVAVIVLITILLSVFVVQQSTAAVIQRFGKFARVAGAGLNLKLPWIETVAATVDLRVRQLDVKVETKTKDNVFAVVMVSVQYYVLPEKVYEAYYRLSNADRQITSYVFDVVRASVPATLLDDVFLKKDEIAMAIKGELTDVMDDYGYGIMTALVTDIDPDPEVKHSMNQINANRRLREAAAEKAEADRLILVAAARAEAESKKLQGEGIAAQRAAIVTGLKESVEQFQHAVAGTTAQDVMTLVMMTQYFDTLSAIGAQSKTNTLIVPHSPSGMSDLASQIQQSMLATDLVKEGKSGAPIV